MVNKIFNRSPLTGIYESISKEIKEINSNLREDRNLEYNYKSLDKAIVSLLNIKGQSEDETLNLIDKNIIMYYVNRVSMTNKSKEKTNIKQDIDILKNILEMPKMTRNINYNKFMQNRDIDYAIAQLIFESVENLKLLSKKYKLTKTSERLKKIERLSGYRKIKTYLIWGETEKPIIDIPKYMSNRTRKNYTFYSKSLF